MTLLAPLDLAFPGSLLSSVAPTHVLTALAAILVTAVAVLGQLYNVEKRIKFIEPDALLVIVLVIASLAMIFYLRETLRRLTREPNSGTTTMPMKSCRK